MLKKWSWTMSKYNLVDRPIYVKRILDEGYFDQIKVLTGIRRCGKTYILKNVVNTLLEQGVQENKIHLFDLLSANFNSFKDSDIEFKKQINLIMDDGEKHWLLLDEVQEIKNYAETLISIHKQYGDLLQIIVTGSNSKVQSKELLNSIGSDSIEISIYPLSYKEFVNFVKLKEKQSPLDAYFEYGGMPNSVKTKGDLSSFKSIYDDVINNDSILKCKIEGINLDSTILQRLSEYFSVNTGHEVDKNSLVDAINRNRSQKLQYADIDLYISALINSYYLYNCVEASVDKNGILGINRKNKIYCIDFALANYIAKGSVGDGAKIETMVLIDLLYRCINFEIGKFWKDNKKKDILKEIDFVVKNKLYIQCAKQMTTKEKIDNEFNAFDRVLSNPGRKVMIVLNDFDHSLIDDKYSSVEIIKLEDWLLRNCDY